jgi:8-oxo-dGTP pyrophosphatase MutT (NUDIX family)
MPHIHHKIDFTSEVFVVCKDKVLLRKHDKLGIWLSVGGHVEINEDPCEAAIREVKEEVGLDVELINNNDTSEFNSDLWKSLIAPLYVNRHNITNEHEHVTFVFFAKADDMQLSLSETEKSDECKWFSLEDLESENHEIKENIKFYAKKALECFRK